MANMIKRLTNLEIIMIHKVRVVIIRTIMAIVTIAMNYTTATIIMVEIILIPITKPINGLINNLTTAMHANKADTKKNITLSSHLANTVIVPPQMIQQSHLY